MRRPVRRRPDPSPEGEAPRIRLVVGLGNPGPKYARTRHNVGQVVVERLAERLGVRKFSARYAGSFAETRGPGGPVALLIPTTFMDLSGDSVSPAAGNLRATAGQVLVVHDELDLPFGVVRGKVGGGAGGHNGLRSIIGRLKSQDFGRIRLGVGRPPEDWRGDQADWVLSGFSEPQTDVDTMIDRGVAMVEAALEHGMDDAISRFHAAAPGARAARRRERSASDDAASDTDGPAAGGDTPT